ncbi:ABC transporter permease subunit [Pseudomonas sp. NPDC007930]|uniref:ABC transporter permease n=1 Tax=Pseudomonas sp. NPDC007930 TaxID=3364417 RepID=UPI0036E1095B
MGTWGLAALVGVFYAGPLLSLAVGAFRNTAPGQPGHWTLAAWRALVADERLREALGNALLLASANLLIAVPLAVLLAWLAVRSDLPGRRAITPAMLVMFALPSLFYAMGYELLANPYTGLLNGILGRLGVAFRFNIETLTGLVAVNTFRCVAFSYLFLLGPVKALASEQEEASRTAGRSATATFWRISLPALAPAISAAALFALMGGLEVFDLAMIIGVPANLPIVAVQLYDWLSQPQPRYGQASALALSLVALLALAMALRTRGLGARGFVSIGGKAQRRGGLSLGYARWPLSALVWAYLGAAQLLPIGTLIYASFQPLPGVAGPLGLVHYRVLFASPGVASAVGNTFWLAATLGATVSACGLALAQLQQSLPALPRRWIQLCTAAPLAMPGVVVALAITWSYVATPGLRALYGSFAMMSIALLIALTPLAVQLGQASLAQVAPQLFEAARVCGATPLAAWFSITLRLCLPGFLAGWYLALIAIAGALDIPLLLGGPGLETLATQVFTFNARGQPGEAAALLCVLLLFILLPLLPLAAWRARQRLLPLFTRSRDDSYRTA